MEKEDNLGLSLIDTIASSEATGVAQDLAEIAIDSVLKDGLLRDIPVIGSIVGVSKTVLAIRDYLLIQKILAFLKAIDGISEEDRAKFINGMDEDKNHKRQVGEHLIMLLDRLDHLDKPAMIAKLFKAYLKNDINFDEFNRFSSVIDRIFVNDLEQLFLYMQGDIRPEYSSGYQAAQSLLYVGLSYISFDESGFQKKESDPFDKIGNHSSSVRSGQALRFVVTFDAYLISQIILEQNVRGTDFIAEHKKQRQQRGY